MINAAITPGTQPHKVSKQTIRNDPHPLSTIDSGGRIIANNTRNRLILFDFYTKNKHFNYMSSTLSTYQENLSTNTCKSNPQV